MIAALRYATHRLMGGGNSGVAAAARRSWVVHPAVTGRRPPALFLEGQLERVERVQEETTLQFELARVLGGEVVHAATIAYELADATISGGSVFAGGTRVRLVHAPFFPAGLRPVEEELDAAALDCTFVGNRYFAHWLLDDCPLHLLARDHAPPLGLERPVYAQEPDYLELLGLARRQVRAVRVRRFVMFQDHGQNPHKRARHERLRAAVLARARPGVRPGVYLRRGHSGVARVLSNEEEIEARLVQRGFAVLDPEVASVAEVVAACAGAPTVVGVEGSQLAHALLGLVAPGGLLVALQPPWRFNNYFKDLADCLGLLYAFVIGMRGPSGFCLDPAELERTLDLAGVA